MAEDNNISEQFDNRTLQEKREAEVDAAFQNPNNLIIPGDLEQEMKSAFIDYAMSVITDRAIPDARDGLKPVHRRILYSMYTQGFTHDKPFRKCATTVGDVLGRFHPHGDAAVYDSLVRMAQSFSMRHILVDGHGNFGSRDGDPPAAYRYTEARLTRLSSEMMTNINKDTVNFQPNFDEHEMEPEVLPAPFPNLLVNGSTGIAVGMATNIPPHNMGEAIDATIHLIRNPEADADDLMNIIPGPDFPTAGIIMGTAGIKSAYRTGRGRIVVRAKTEIEEMRNGRYRIVVHELPYMVNKARLIERIAELMKDKRIDGISDLRDESDRNQEVRIVIELKRDATPNVVLNQLFRFTQMQDTFSANILALVKDEDNNYVPRILNLTEALQQFIDFRRDVITRRTAFDKERAEARKHIVEGLQLAIDHIDEVINIIRASASEAHAKQNLVKRFVLSEKQAQHVVDMRLGRLSGLERDKLQAEADDLEEKIAYYTSVLTDSGLLDQIVIDELEDTKKRYANERRSYIDPAHNFQLDIEDESLIEEAQIVITMTNKGYIKGSSVETYSAQRRGGRGITGVQARDEDFADTIITTHTHDILLFFTNKGNVYHMKGYQIPEAGRHARGTAIVNLLRLDPDERVSGLIPIETFDQDVYLLMSTKNGLIKKTKLRNYRNIHRGGLIAINLREEDELVGVELVTDKDDVILATNQGKAIRFKQSDVRATARNTMGVKGITLSKNDFVIGMVTTESNGNLLIVTENGYGKATDLNEYRVQNRGGKGIITYKITERTGKAVKIALIEKNDNCDLLLINDQGIVIRIATSEIPLLSRNTQGVTLMRSKEGEGKVVDLAIVYPEEDENLENDSEDENNELETTEENMNFPIENETDDEEFVVENEAENQESDS
ncbi:MAG TPA: DNA gyrase subunit A [Clostridiaceae bacterium]|nr:DNA gyrase subunit A [Clostridiaceae bacterium]